MGFHEIRFPTNISYGSLMTIEDNVTVVETLSGQTVTWKNWSQTRLKANVAFGLKTSSELAELIEFFHVRRGPANGFRFKNWADYSATSQLATETSSTKVYQVYKNYTDTGGTYAKLIKKLVSGTVTVTDKAVTVSTSKYTVNHNKGLITLSTVPSSNIRASFQYDVPMRFASNELPQTLDFINLTSIREINLVETKETTST